MLRMRGAEPCCLQTCHHDGDGGVAFGRMVGNVIAVDGGGLDVILEPGRAIAFLPAKRMVGMASAHRFGRKVSAKFYRDEADSNAVDTSNEVGDGRGGRGVNGSGGSCQNRTSNRRTPKAPKRTDSFGFLCR